MHLDEPSWWYGPRDAQAGRLLAPLAALYGWASARRMCRPPRIELPVPVICVGNFTAGGTGKTPLSLHLAAHVMGRGLRPVFLTRGYGGRRSAPGYVDRSLDTAADVGDEPLLLAQVAPVMVARDREAGARTIISGPVMADVVIMDDGLQNPAVARDLRIAVVDRKRGVGNGRVIPAGPLRAPLELQLGLVDAVVVNGLANSIEPVGDAAAWLRTKFPGPVIDAAPAPDGDTSWLAGRRVVAFAGIANPQRFFTLLQGLGAIVEERVVFPDHFEFSDADAQRLMAMAEAKDAQLVTTEKDRMRLIGRAGACRQLESVSKTLPIRLAFPERDAERLAVMVDAAIARKRSRASVSDRSGS